MKLRGCWTLCNLESVSVTKWRWRIFKSWRFVANTSFWNIILTKFNRRLRRKTTLQWMHVSTTLGMNYWRGCQMSGSDSKLLMPTLALGRHKPVQRQTRHPSQAVRTRATEATLVLMDLMSRISTRNMAIWRLWSSRSTNFCILLKLIAQPACLSIVLPLASMSSVRQQTKQPEGGPRLQQAGEQGVRHRYLKMWRAGFGHAICEHAAAILISNDCQFFFRISRRTRKQSCLSVFCFDSVVYCWMLKESCERAMSAFQSCRRELLCSAQWVDASMQANSRLHDLWCEEAHDTGLGLSQIMFLWNVSFIDIFWHYSSLCSGAIWYWCRDTWLQYQITWKIWPMAKEGGSVVALETQLFS